ncbi:TetR family transcriptional regulator [Palleronia pelagia]|uniref:Transcriptional regulator, TetR family n=1 Tax=Palleronia pelagia TaxID=387096 RepID=A0A1H8LPI0_9RHOB|nr:TetR family transcriptional regulator [Palleronia pelagia]SEO07025.1 transcriptional regulator, TetR family [Palleronia pelagia]
MPDRARRWKQDPAAVKADILAAARREFAANGFAGARVERIVEGTKTSKRMLFYYFGGKEGLYRAVLADAYEQIRAQEEALDLGGLEPAEALAKLVRFTFDHHRANPDFIRLVMIENIHHGRHLAEIPQIGDTNRAVIDQLERICAEGIASGLFRDDASAIALHWQISALSFFNVSNRVTFEISFGDALFTESAQIGMREQVVNSILGSVLNPVLPEE